MHSGFQMTVESNHAIALVLVLVLVAFRMGQLVRGFRCFPVAFFGGFP